MHMIRGGYLITNDLNELNTYIKILRRAYKKKQQFSYPRKEPKVSKNCLRACDSMGNTKSITTRTTIQLRKKLCLINQGNTLLELTT